MISWKRNPVLIDNVGSDGVLVVPEAYLRGHFQLCVEISKTRVPAVLVGKVNLARIHQRTVEIPVLHQRKESDAQAQRVTASGPVVSAKGNGSTRLIGKFPHVYG